MSGEKTRGKVPGYSSSDTPMDFSGVVTRWWRMLSGLGVLFVLQVFVAGAGLAGSLPATLSNDVTFDEGFMSIRWLGAIRLVAEPTQEVPVAGLSDLAWDSGAGLLYAISDLGWLLHLKLDFEDMRLRSAVVAAGFPLRGPDGSILTSRDRDAEGLVLRRQADASQKEPQLIVSFEGQPRLWLYTPDGRWQGELGLPEPLTRQENFDTPNHGLEAVAVHPRFGVLLAPERAMRDYPPGQLPLLSRSGHEWRYPLGPFSGSALTAMEILPDGSLLTLERAFVSPLIPIVIALRRSCLDDSGDVLLTPRNVAVLDAGEGWILDNFEGLTRLEDRRLLMVSDDNEHILQSTYLVHLEIMPVAPLCRGAVGS